MKQTAVNSLIEELLPFIDRSKISDVALHLIIEKHTAMEKELMCECYNEGLYQDINSDTLLPFEQYYNETFQNK